MWSAVAERSADTALPPTGKLTPRPSVHHDAPNPNAPPGTATNRRCASSPADPWRTQESDGRSADSLCARIKKPSTGPRTDEPSALLLESTLVPLPASRVLSR